MASPQASGRRQVRRVTDDPFREMGSGQQQASTFRKLGEGRGEGGNTKLVDGYRTSGDTKRRSWRGWNLQERLQIHDTFGIR